MFRFALSMLSFGILLVFRHHPCLFVDSVGLDRDNSSTIPLLPLSDIPQEEKGELLSSILRWDVAYKRLLSFRTAIMEVR